MGAYAPYEPGASPRPRIEAEIRLATPDDAGTIASLYATRHGKPIEEVEPDVAAEIERQRTGIGPSRVFVAAAKAGVIGYGRIRHVVPGEEGQPTELPAGWYLMGVIVAPAWRRRGVASALGRARLAWIAERAQDAWCFTNRANRAAADLHRSLGFEPVELTFAHERAGLAAGEGRLFRCRLRIPRSRKPSDTL